MNRFGAPRAPTLSAVVWIGGLITISIGLTQLINGRAAFLHVGAMMATIMAGNVFWTIVPSQRELVKSVAEGSSAVCVLFDNYFVAGGMRTLLMTWMTPLEAITSAVTTCALLTKTFPPLTRIASLPSSRVMTSFSCTTFATVSWPLWSW